MTATDRLAAIGPFFEVSLHDPEATQVAGWEPLTRLIHGSAFTERAAGTRTGLAARARVSPVQIDARVAVSVTQLALTARLLSPVLGAAVLGLSLRIEPRDSRWQPVSGGPFPLSVPSAALTGSGHPPEAVSAALNGVVTDLVETASAQSTSEQVLWGNVASAAHSALLMIAGALPGHGRAVADLTSEVFGHDRLREAATITPGGHFRRSSCCLIYRALTNSPATAQICGDCVLQH